MTTGISQLDMIVGAGLFTVLPVIFTMGLMSGLSPCSIPTVALVVGYVSKADNTRRLHGFLLALSFVMGIAIVLTVLGGISGYAGGLLLQSKLLFAKGSIGMKIFLGSVCFIFIMLGFWMLNLINFNGVNLMERIGVRQQSGPVGAFLLGLPFGIAASPCTLPVTIAVLIFLAAKGSFVLGALLMFSYAAGRSIPILLAGTCTGFIKGIRRFDKIQFVMEKIGGLVMITIGVYFIFKSILKIDLLKMFF
ncbi:cytochrome c biogenesis CcdA family protein [Geobacter sp. SVR]|uniref:cytochrome c biogenesis CcdA family protein n=1 Tax=Geobacter sp. SVR TaxID=2495594 RepID=UPI00143EF97E|nr:cytochrome c biogenesis CcdA family protein [Geobacter sp. SVR]BCS51956.1 cytochrome c biogenesis protein [Geobacter sp. SVR]GCF87229.1 cytochrome C biogenesis protein CcdA [Geobacter sp. SVR]